METQAVAQKPAEVSIPPTDPAADLEERLKRVRKINIALRVDFAWNQKGAIYLMLRVREITELIPKIPLMIQQIQMLKDFNTSFPNKRSDGGISFKVTVKTRVKSKPSRRFVKKWERSKKEGKRAMEKGDAFDLVGFASELEAFLRKAKTDLEIWLNGPERLGDIDSSTDGKEEDENEDENEQYEAEEDNSEEEEDEEEEEEEDEGDGRPGTIVLNPIFY